MRRREFLTTTILGGTATLLGVHSTPAGAEPPPETAALTLTHLPTICFAPQYVAEELLRAEGFTDVRYAKLAMGDEFYKFLASADVSFTMDLAALSLAAMDRGQPLVILAGVHVGCYQLFGSNGVRTVRDLKGRTVAVRRQYRARPTEGHHVGGAPRRGVDGPLRGGQG
jgi:NitT/TauT family transport system substrate-binding protein